MCVGLPVEYAGTTSTATQEVTACLLLSLLLGRRKNCVRWTPGTAHAAGQTGMAIPPGALGVAKQKLHQRECRGDTASLCTASLHTASLRTLSLHWEEHGTLACREWGEANVSHFLAPLRKHTEGGTRSPAAGKERLIGPSAWCKCVLPLLLHWCKASTHFLWASLTESLCKKKRAWARSKQMCLKIPMQV